MVSNKKRLYVALYPTGAANATGVRQYHWALLIGPKVENNDEVPGARYHVKNPINSGWVYEELELANVRNTVNLLARVIIGKITDERRLVEIIRATPVIQNDPEWRCRSWVRDVIIRVAQDGRCVGTGELSWPTIEATARDYVGRKIDEGRYGRGTDPRKPKPTWDLVEHRETVP